MSNAQYTNVNNVKRVKQTHDDKHNTKHDGSLFISGRKRVKEEDDGVAKQRRRADVVITWTHVVEQH